MGCNMTKMTKATTDKDTRARARQLFIEANDPSDDDLRALMTEIDAAMVRFIDARSETASASMTLRALIGLAGAIIQTAPRHLQKGATEKMMHSLAHSAGYLSSPFELEWIFGQHDPSDKVQ